MSALEDAPKRRNAITHRRSDTSEKNFSFDHFSCTNEVSLEVCHLQIQVLHSSQQKLLQFQDFRIQIYLSLTDLNI
jgi:hypothetical protein